jgi:hypothetical protein
MNRILYNWQIDELGYNKSAEQIVGQKTCQFLQGYKPYGGSQWWSLTGTCVESVLESWLKGGELFDFYRHTLCPDEMLFQTFLMNSQHRETLVNNNLRKIEWHSYLVSVVMSAYNIEKYIKEAIDSILSQTFGDFELIIVDDGSEDNTTNIIKSYDDKRIRLIEMPHNFINSLNTGINAARGKYIAKMDADDVMEPERLEVQFEYMEMHPETDACGSYANYAGRSNEQIRVPLKHNDIAIIMFTANAIINPSSFIRRETPRRSGYPRS